MTGKRKLSRTIRSLGMVCLAALALTACRGDEQGRIIKYEPGVYKGKPDTELGEAKREELRSRAMMQAGATGTGIAGGGGPKISGSDVRAPGADLGQRALKQGGAN